MAIKESHFSEDYYTKFRHVTSLKKWLFSQLIDCRQPVYFALLKRFKKGSHLLDFGSGSGLFAMRAAKDFHYIGVDFSSKAIELAKKQCFYGHFLKGSLPQIKKMRPSRFDIITCFDVLEHLLNVDEYISAFWKLLKNDGWLVVSVPIADSIALRVREQHWLGFEDSSHIRIISRSDWLAKFRENGFIPIRCWSSGVINSPTPEWSIGGWLKILHFITQPLALMGVYLPAALTDEDYYVLINNQHFKS